MLTLAEEVQDRGFAIRRGWLAGETTEIVASTIGDVAYVAGVRDVQVLRPHALEQATPNTYSGNYGLGEFPFHTDLAHWALPPRYFLLRCLSGAKAVATLLLDGRRLIEATGSVVLSRAIVQPRRPVAGQRPLLRLLHRWPNQDALLRWDAVFIIPATRSGQSGFEAVRAFLATAQPERVALESPGDVIVVDNWRMLHGRSPAPIAAQARCIERVYLNTLS